MSEKSPSGTHQTEINSPPGGLPAGPRPSDILRRRLRESDPVRSSSPLRRRMIAIYERPPSPLDGPVTLVFVLSLLVLLICIGYFLYGIWGGMLDNPKYQHVLSHADRLRVLGNLALVQHAAIYSGIIASITYLFLLYHEEIAGYLLMAFSLILFLAIPVLSTSFVSSMREAPSAATVLVMADIRMLALITAIPALALIGMDLFVRGYFGLDEARIRAVQARDSRKRLKRKRAPYLLLGPCWRKPGGALSQRCLYDEVSMSSTKAGQALQKVMRRMDGTAQWDPFDTELAPGERPLTRQQKKQVCRHCRHFQAHQSQKYNVIASALAAGTAGLLVFFHDQMIGYILSTFETTHNAMGRFSFTPSTGVPSLPQLPGVDISPESMVPITAAWVILVIGCLIVLAKALQLIEYCCFKLKI